MMLSRKCSDGYRRKQIDAPIRHARCYDGHMQHMLRYISLVLGVLLVVVVFSACADIAECTSCAASCCAEADSNDVARDPSVQLVPVIDAVLGNAYVSVVEPAPALSCDHPLCPIDTSRVKRLRI